MTYRHLIYVAVGAACLSTGPAFAYTPATYDNSLDVGQDFTAATGFTTTIWNDIYAGGTGAYWLSGEATDALMLSISTPFVTGATDIGVMQDPSSCSQGFGYGRFHWRAKAGQYSQGFGINLILWNADNSWGSPANVTASGVHTIDEWDALEASAGTGYINIHANNGVNGVSPPTTTTIAFASGKVTTYHDYDVDWTAGSMIEYVDGVVQASASGAKVPADYADGGCNKTLGFQATYKGQAEPLAVVQLNIANSWHANVIPTIPATATIVPIGTISAPVIAPATSNVAENIIAAYAYTTGTPRTVKLVVDGVTENAQTAILAGGVLTTALPTNLIIGNHAVEVEDALSSVIVSAPTIFTVSAAAATTATVTAVAPMSITSTSYSALHLLTLNVTKTTGKPQTLRFIDNGKYLGVLRDNAADGVLALHWLYTTAPTIGTHTVTVYVDGGASATGTFTAD